MVFVKGEELHFYTQLHNRDAIKNSFHLFGCENFTICSVNKLPVNLAKDLLMVKTVGPRLMMSLICCVVASAVSAHPFFTPVSDSHDSHGYRADNPAPALFFAVPQSDETPKLWSEMSAKERAEIWPFLTPRMQRYYWRSMTEPERRSMRAEFPPSINEKFRKRYVSPDNCQTSAIPYESRGASKTSRANSWNACWVLPLSSSACSTLVRPDWWFKYWCRGSPKRRMIL